MLAAQRQQGAVTVPPGIRSIARHRLQTTRLPSLLRIRVRYLPVVRLVKAGELGTPTFSNQRGKFGIREASEVQEGRIGALFFSHENQGNEGAEQLQRHGRLERARLVAAQGRQAFAVGAIAHLVMVLQEENERSR